MTFNQTLICGSNLLPTETLANAHNLLVKPVLIYCLIFILSISIFIGMLIFKSATGKKTFFIYWLITGIAIAAFFIFLIASPNSVIELNNFFTNLFS